MAFCQCDRVNGYRPAGLIQDEPRGLFTDLLILNDSSKITACRLKIENKNQGGENEKGTNSIPRPALPRHSRSRVIS